MLMNFGSRIEYYLQEKPTQSATFFTASPRERCAFCAALRSAECQSAYGFLSITARMGYTLFWTLLIELYPARPPEENLEFIRMHINDHLPLGWRIYRTKKSR